MAFSRELGTSNVAEARYPSDEAKDFDLLGYWHIVNPYKWWILGFAVAVSLITYVVVAAETPIYEATATLLIESKQSKIVSIEQFYGADASQHDYFDTQIEVLNSRHLAERVVQDLNLANNPNFDSNRRQGFDIRRFVPFLRDPGRPQRTDQQRFSAAVATLRANLHIQPVRNTQVVRISYESADPQLAPKIANALGDAYMQNFLETQLDMTEKAANWLTGKLKGMRTDLDESEQKLQAFQDKEHLVDVKGITTLTAQELNQLTSQVVEARNRTAAAKNQLDEIGTISGAYNPQWETLPAVLNDGPAQSFKSAEVTAANAFSEVQKTYGPKHPKYIVAETRLEAARHAYHARVRQVVEGFGDAYKQDLADQRQLEAALAKAKSRIQEINAKQFKMEELQRVVDTNKQLYDMFFKRFKETNEIDFQGGNAHFVDRAQGAYGPVRPQKTRAAVVAGVLSLAFGIMLAFLRSVLDNTVRVASEVEEKLGQAILGVIPLELKLNREGVSIARLYLMDQGHAFSEAIRSLRTSVMLSSLDAPHKVTVVTSSVPGEGKTTIASNLALALGQMEKVLLIDSDMRRPTIASEFELKMPVMGLSELVAQTGTLEECIHHLDKSGIDVLPAGSIPPNPLDLLSSGRFAEVLDGLKANYDRIIIDSAPTQAVSDALVLSTKADALIYVVKSDATAANVARNGIERLLRVGAPVIGVVLNQFDPKAAQRYGYDGYDKDGYYAYGYASKSYD